MRPGARLGGLPDADPRPLPVRRRHPSRRRCHGRQRPQLRPRGAPRPAHRAAAERTPVSDAELDAIVVGGGHNGLVAAFYLARRGLRTRRPRAARDPGRRVRHRGVRARIPGVAGRLRAEHAAACDLARHAAARARPPGRPGGAVASTCSATAGGSSCTTATSRRSRRSAGTRPPTRAGSPRFKEELSAIGRLVFPDAGLRRPSGCGSACVPRAPRTFAERMAGLLSTSTRRWLDERFDSEHVKAALGWDAISNTLAGPSTPGTALSLLHEHAAHLRRGRAAGASCRAAWAPSPG